LLFNVGTNEILLSSVKILYRSKVHRMEITQKREKLQSVTHSGETQFIFNVLLFCRRKKRKGLNVPLKE
jgi:hypothetical protein